MKRSDSQGWWERYADKVGILGAMFAALCCLGLPALLTILSSIGLSFLVTDVVLIPLLFVFLLLTLVGLYLGTRHHDQPWAFWLGLVSSLWLITSVIFVPSQVLAGVSIVGLILASLLNVLFGTRQFRVPKARR